MPPWQQRPNFSLRAEHRAIASLIPGTILNKGTIGTEVELKLATSKTGLRKALAAMAEENGRRRRQETTPGLGLF
jgi:hypothetical protein